MGTIVHSVLLSTRRLPSNHTVFHAWLWTGGVVLFLYLSPKLTLPTPR
jgi:hypothetical protein